MNLALSTVAKSPEPATCRFLRPLRIPHQMNKKLPARQPRAGAFRMMNIVLLCIILVVSGCATTRDSSYTQIEAAHANLEGYTNIRSYLDTAPVKSDGAAEWVTPAGKQDVNFLAISGGGAGGAFTVGILKAWSETGARPQFDVVTGVSTGALIAPYAFLGEKYDNRLVTLYTGGGASGLVNARWMGTGLVRSSLLDGAPLREMVERYITADVMRDVALEHRKGRRLLILTTNLDSQRAVVWNMGVIANSGQADGLELFRKVLVASASVPGVFPSVMIDVNADGRTFQEMHSDGGAISQVLTLPDDMLASQLDTSAMGARKFHMYVIVNNALIPEFSETSNRTLSVVGRAYSTLIKSQTRNALFALHSFSQRNGLDFHVAAIDEQVPYSMTDPFNTVYMRTVFRLGYSKMRQGALWKDDPVFSGDEGSSSARTDPDQSGHSEQP